jgi:polar amino acid transport system permease protein
VINTITFEPALVFGTVAAIYFALCWPLSLFGAAMERRLRVDVRRTPLERLGPDVAVQAIAVEEGR